jgi:hypothetical protein
MTPKVLLTAAVVGIVDQQILVKNRSATDSQLTLEAHLSCWGLAPK